MAWSKNKDVPPPRDHRGAVDVPSTVTMAPIGFVRSPYTERHGTPRQAVVRGGGGGGDPMVGAVEIDTERVPETALRDIEGFDRIWLVTYLHLNPKWGPLVRPPRGGIRRGVLATRSPHHPNPIGLSAVALIGREGARLIVQGLDLIDGTPVLDIKPYVPYCDAFPDSSAGWVDALEE
ncbi:MAG: tRNA (N6-threonylcarbamoyladenosine(37)-N6)-methyltransferase TrmO [Myxococcota bacterium]|nr:tRNA (N6-threonylcarbamoyladenosine(37)-N6)-methyltransferase TrmO [Myxococcota bacterium]MEC9389885.1 tRNA (N6-threonylcarbamoyladenosine(37)-N6)-methyltransferase TrmO [Myxococcota bacterium]